MSDFHANPQCCTRPDIAERMRRDRQRRVMQGVFTSTDAPRQNVGDALFSMVRGLVPQRMRRRSE